MCLGRAGADGMWGSVVLLLCQWTCVVGSSVGCYPDRGVQVSGRSEYRLCKLRMCLDYMLDPSGIICAFLILCCLMEGTP